MFTEKTNSWGLRSKECVLGLLERFFSNSLIISSSKNKEDPNREEGLDTRS